MTKDEAEALRAELEAKGQRAAVVSMVELTILRKIADDVECGRRTLDDFAHCAIELGVMRLDDVDKVTQIQLIAYQGDANSGVLH